MYVLCNVIHDSMIINFRIFGILFFWDLINYPKPLYVKN